ncbi:MAG TPA: tripartite tricarboxylate transporter substrate-binding protein [Xanthobacteraceae bacterium]|nr:tripartite tricarboxylate transporter substrate-binding protein [Xanthobacteraceae bacterium]
MTLPRRTFVRLAASAAAAPAISRFAWAAADPSQAVRIVVGFAPDSAADIVARLLARSLSERTGQKFIVDNQTGIGGNIATEMVVNAAPDGHTLLMVGPSSAIDATLYDKLGFDFRRDIAPVAAAVRSPSVMLVNPSVPATTVGEFIAHAKSKPGALTMASAGVGTASHLAGELFKMTTGVEMVHVAYRGGAGAYADLLDGRADVYFPSLISAREHLKSGALRTLALPGDQATSTWFGVGAPRHTPAGIVERLNAEINAALADPQVAAQVAHGGGTVIAGSASDFGKLIADETEKWARVITASGTTLS